MSEQGFGEVGMAPDSQHAAAQAHAAAGHAVGRVSLGEVFHVFLRLGLTSFGGPIAHLGYFREEFVVRRRWIGERAYADLVALCQFLPGPASSQVGISIGLAKAGLPGALAAWFAFTMPSAILLVLFGLGIQAFGTQLGGGWLHGLKVVAVAVVAQAVLGMARNLCPDKERAAFATVAAVVALIWTSALGQVAVIVLGGVAGWLLLTPSGDGKHVPLGIAVPRGLALGCLALFAALLVVPPAITATTPNAMTTLLESFYRAGALVFGGGHVVLPLLQQAVVPTGWVSNDAFLAGYGAAQAVPGPLFTFAAYLGVVSGPAPASLITAALCLVAIFLPCFLLVLGALPFWDALRQLGFMRAAMMGINAAVVGLLLAALYDPVWTSAIRRPADFAVALAAFVLLELWRVPPWIVVILSAAAGAAIGA
jgi:chromate transporter